MNQTLGTVGEKTVILVNGVPASGKSSVAVRLSHHFALPYLTVDGIKEPFMHCFPQLDRQLNRTLGRAAYQAIWAIVAQAPAQCVYVIDAWFGFQPKDDLRRYLQQAGVTQVVEIWNQVSGELAAARYAARLHQRAKGHPGAEYLPELRELARRATPMALGPVLRVDQSQPLDMPRIITWLQSALSASVSTDSRSSAANSTTDSSYRLASR
ncbi:AAA family ATPase [Serratia sp. AKBS12]|uniref:AAA family ATPase n=1 Tax=Serratia sp. AKBS12 TaxID=2974597 RepID=UPI002165B20B|nr:AAA family ATPase [Serratia sp. AKBS12]MCS3408804.1 AAA family ATPase [Serratia sp. AKBS12]